jgi:DNA-binding CsgD family transcriptional regulator
VLEKASHAGITAGACSVARIVAQVADGRTNEEIAERLRIRPKTVEWNLTRIYPKLNVRSRAELAVLFVTKRGSL